DSFRLSS
ncbi:hypothetical protein ECFRIK523_2370, partial [Escherichia coli FRIK523]